jgi:hypothetical protein
VFTDQRNGAAEIGIGHAGHGDQQMIVEGTLDFHASSIDLVLAADNRFPHRAMPTVRPAPGQTRRTACQSRKRNMRALDCARAVIRRRAIP